MATQPLHDGDLARAVTAGSAAAEAELALRFAPRIRLYGRRHLGQPEAAEDLVQEVLMIVLLALRAGRVDDPEHIERFMLGTCRNTAAAWRRGEHRVRALAAEAAQAADRAELVVLPELPRGPDLVRLTGCIDRLPPRERSVLMWSFCEEDSAEAIGTRLGLSPGNVRVLRHRALARVRDCVDSGGAP